MIKKMLRPIYHNLRYAYWKCIDGLRVRKYGTPDIRSIEETIQYVIDNKVSVSRFGDGEFSWMEHIYQWKTFQDDSEELSERLKEVIRSNRDNHIICLSGTFGKLDEFNKDARYFWTEFMYKHRLAWYKYLDMNRTYYNTYMSRLYIDFEDKSKVQERFNLIKKIWEDKNILIVEGEKTRLGVGNDLFQKAKSIRRILAPSKNAFSKYSEILDAVKRNAQKDDVVLIALGPTATVLAYDLACCDIQGIDIGHVDIEYEWFKMGATEKVPIKNKYTNEAANFTGTNVGKSDDEVYESQIVETI